MDAMKDDSKAVKTLLDGDGTPAVADASGVLETRPGQCREHGVYIDQQIQLRVYLGRKPVPIPFWLGCPECRHEADAANELEAKRWRMLLPGEPSWSRLRGR